MSPNELHNSNMSDERITPYPLRIPPEMREKLESAAKAGNRSLHAEIMMRLEKSLSTQTISPHSIAPPPMEPVLLIRKDIKDLNKRIEDILEKFNKS